MTEQTVAGYIEQFPPAVQAALSSMREAIRSAIPKATETISYGIPAYTLAGTPVVYFAGWKRHLSLYPVPRADEAFLAALAPYRSGRGTLRFSLDDPLPIELVEEVVRRLARERASS